MTTTIAMPSVTHAMKGQKLLRGAGYACEVEKGKRDASSGCVYRLVAETDANTVLRILERNGIPYYSFTEG